MAIDRMGPPNQPPIQPDRSGTAQPKAAAGEAETTGKILGAETLRELEQIRNDPSLDTKIKTALADLHKQLSSGFKGKPLSASFQTGHNSDTVTLQIKENSQAKKQGTDSFSLKVYVSRFDDPTGSSSRLVMPLTSESTLLNTILLPQTTTDTKAIINTAYEHLYTDWHH